MTKFPLVDKNDDGIRPAGKPDQCFYCQQKVGSEHKKDCRKGVMDKYIIEAVKDGYSQYEVDYLVKMICEEELPTLTYRDFIVRLDQLRYA